jgi:hypothetical protein
LGAHALDVLLQLFLCDLSVDIMEMVDKGQARCIFETSDGVVHYGEDDGWDCGDDEIGEDGIRIIPEDELCEKGLMLLIVFRNFGVCCLVLVGGEGWRDGQYLERHAANAALFVVGGVGGEGQMAMDSVSSRRVDRRGVGVEFNVCDKDGGESRSGVGVANFRQHRVLEVEIVGCHSGFFMVRKIK